MITMIIVTFIDLFVDIMNVCILVRVVWGWFQPDLREHRVGRIFYEITEPILAPVRKLIPNMGGAVDFSPFATFILLQVFQLAAHVALAYLVG